MMASKEFAEKFQIKSMDLCSWHNAKTGELEVIYDPPMPWYRSSDHEYEEAKKNYELALERKKKEKD